jgi:hypothetical protein
LGSIEAQPRAIAIEGRAADLRASRLLVAAPATIGVTPRPAQLLRTYPLSAQPVGLALMPRPAILRLSRVLKAVKQDIAIAPKPADLIYTPIPDPSFANVSCLLHFDGANGSTAFTDSGPLGLTVTAIGNAQISTAQSKFGGSSLLLDGAGDRISIAAGTHFSFGTGAWTIEFWIRTSQTNQGWGLMQNRGLDTATQFSWGYNFNSAGTMRMVERITVKSEPSATGINNGNWNHVAMTRSSNTVRMFLNGMQVGSYTTSYTFWDSTTALVLGGFYAGSSGEDISGYVDDLRITKGVARYAANFTPPTAAFPNS